MISWLRNNIHGAANQGAHVGSIENLNMAEVEIPDANGADFWARIVRIGDPAGWGVLQRGWTSSNQVLPYSVRIEPYLFSIRVTDECLALINEVMDRTEVDRLLPATFDKAQLRTVPLDYEFFSLKLRDKVSYLGSA
jgi:hypothetical protein